MIEEHQSASREGVASAWPYYSAAARGFRNYWYPVTWSRRIGQGDRLDLAVGGQPHGLGQADHQGRRVGQEDRFGGRHGQRGHLGPASSAISRSSSQSGLPSVIPKAAFGLEMFRHP